MSGQFWRDFLAQDYLRSERKLVDKDTRAARRHQGIMNIMADALNGPGVSLTSDEVPTVEWCGRKYSVRDTLSTQAIHGILWELYELNFRAELFALDARVCSPTDLNSMSRQDLVSECFPPTESRMYMPFLKLPERNEGLAADHPHDRLPYLLALKRLMSSWVGEKPREFSLADKKPHLVTEEDIFQFEQAIAAFYTQTYFQWSGRAPIVFHRLHCSA
jgi:hypothetical protein